MDLEREGSAHESVADNEVAANNGDSENSGDSVNKNESNGDVGIDQVKQLLDADRLGNKVRDGGVANLTPVVVEKNSGSDLPLSYPGRVEKGKGLRKWKRIKREVTEDGGVIVDSSKLVKRGFSNAGVRGKVMVSSSDMKQRSEGSVSSTQAMVQRLPGSVDGFDVVGDSGLAMGRFLSTEADSENSDDCSSKYASIAKIRYGAPVVAGQVYDRNKIANMNGKNFGSSVQKNPQGKAQTKFSKKPRGEQVNIENETSHSSMESDSRSSNVFMQDNRSVTRNGRQNGGSTNYGGENGRKTLADPQQLSEKLPSGYGRNSDGESEDVSQEDHDGLIESIHMLQSTKEAIEKELQRFREIGKEDSAVDNSDQDSCLPSELMSGGLEVNGSSDDHSPRSLSTLESEVSTLKENVHLMEIKLEETTTTLEVKEAKIRELESRLGSTTNKKEMGKVHGLNYLDSESELETLFKQKIEVEIEYLTISKRIQDLRVVSVDQISQLEYKIVSEQSQIMNKLIDVESKAVNLKGDAEKLEKHCEDVVIADETMKLQTTVCKYTTCFLIQLILLAVLLLLLLSQLSPHSDGVAPT